MIVYFIRCWDQEVIDCPEIVAQRIINYNPDRIIVWCAEEYAYYEIFNPLFDLLEKWALTNNKIVNLITTFKTGEIRSWILAEGTYGLLYNFMFAHRLAYPDNPIFIDDKFISIDKDVPPDQIQPTKLFTCYNHNAHKERGLMVDSLARDNLIDLGIVSFHYPNQYNWKYHTGKKLVDELDYQILAKEYSPNMIPINQKIAFMDVVTESRYDFEEYFLTEKTLKSIMLGRPFLVLSCTGFHQYLVDHLQLKLYDEIFDYSFDNKNTIKDRVEGIITNLHILKKFIGNTEKLNQLYNKIKPKLIYNRNRIEEIFSNKDLVVPKSFQFLTENNDITILGAEYADFPDYMNKMGWSNNKLNKL